jgi:Flp pilus assembly secretin CpaC
MCRVMLSLGLVFCCVVSTVLGQSAGTRSDSRSVRQGPPSTAGRSPVRVTDRGGRAPVKQFDRQPKMVMVQALLVTVSFDGDDQARAAGSLADALAKKINTDAIATKIPISTLTKGLDTVVKENAKTATIESLTGLEMVTLAGQVAFVQIGGRKPRIVGTTATQRGRVNSIQLENVGTILSVTPQIVPDGSLVLAVEIERSDLGPEGEGMVIETMEDGKEVRSPQIDTLTARTTIAAANGEAVVINDLVLGERSRQKETFVIVRPLVMGGSDGG